MLILKILLWLLGIIIITCSFFFIEEESYSPTQAKKEDLFKATHFTKLTNFVRNIYMVLMMTFIGLSFLL
ncbi:MAG: hypothetical protein I3273_00930 [Candidatus Moeniiplasma glomeromycotorum]|nr:hypothetical protein [Candidatus Moeniiplasma glomeromycotorum]MCE8167313.1 hypothetical protein [Candidatus Moeniiplasma glomeromycotorum]MCE8168673.1 hypothetical protein [Candidatus Moeniiplasma glomeromycotorum]